MSRARKLRRSRRWARYLNHYDHVRGAYIEGAGLQRAIRDSDWGTHWQGVRSGGEIRLAGSRRCRTFWGSHGCDRAEGHRGNHECGSNLWNSCMSVTPQGRDVDAVPDHGFRWTLFTV